MTVTDDTVITRQAWNEHVRTLRWEQGDHALIAAPTRAGKTTLARRVIEKRSHVVMLVTKTHDDTFRTEYKGWARRHSFDEIRPWDTRVLLWPKAGKTLRDTLAMQRDVMRDSLDRIGRGDRSGWSGWGVVVDESHYMTDPKFLGLDREIAMLHHVGRSAGISMLDLTQRPSWIPRIIYSSVTHAWIARTRDRDDQKRLSDLGNIDARTIGDALSTLPTRHDYVYLNPQGDAPPRIVNTRK